MRIGFIFPSSEYLHNPFKGDPHTHLQILTVLDDRFGDKVALHLIDLRGIKRAFAMSRMPECDLYLHSLYTLDFNEQVAIVRGLKDRFPKARHIAGGPHATVFSDECLKLCDSVVLGDGEESIVKAVNDLRETGQLKPIYEEKEELDINEYPIPSRRFLPEATVARRGMMTLKTKPGGEKMLGTTVIFSRGCPFRCIYCTMPQMKKFSSGLRYRDPHLVEQEILYLKKSYGMEGINLLDEIGIPIGRDKAIAHLEAIGRAGITWRGQTRVDCITAETAKLARQSGCVAMGLGVESVEQQCLDIINKKATVEKARGAIRLLKENDIEVRIYLMLGLPAEPDDIVERTWRFIQEASPDIVILSLFSIRPGTEVFNQREKYGIRTVSEDWDKTMHMFGRYENETPTLTFEYAENTPWGKSKSPDRIVKEYMELQTKLRETGLSAV